MKRFIVTLTDQQHADLEVHRQRLGLRSQAEVVRVALDHLEAVKSLTWSAGDVAAPVARMAAAERAIAAVATLSPEEREPDYRALAAEAVAPVRAQLAEAARLTAANPAISVAPKARRSTKASDGEAGATKTKRAGDLVSLPRGAKLK